MIRSLGDGAIGSPGDHVIRLRRHAVLVGQVRIGWAGPRLYVLCLPHFGQPTRLQGACNRFLGDEPLRAEESFSGAHQLHSTASGVVAR